MNALSLIKKGLIFSGLINIGAILLFSQFFTNEHLAQYPLFSNASMLLIVAWGLAFIFLSPKVAILPEMLLAFAFEKSVFVTVAVCWWSKHFDQLKAMFEQDFWAASMQVLYGPNDLLGLLFFIGAYIYLKKNPERAL